MREFGRDMGKKLLPKGVELARGPVFSSTFPISANPVEHIGGVNFTREGCGRLIDQIVSHDAPHPPLNLARREVYELVAMDRSYQHIMQIYALGYGEKVAQIPCSIGAEHDGMGANFGKMRCFGFLWQFGRGIEPGELDEIERLFKDFALVWLFDSLEQFVYGVAKLLAGLFFGEGFKVLPSPVSYALAPFEAHLCILAGSAHFFALASTEIQKLEQQISDRKQSIEEAKTKAQQVASGCKAEAGRLDDVLEFFTMDIAPSKFAP